MLAQLHTKCTFYHFLCLVFLLDLLHTIEFSAAPALIDIISIWMLCQSPIQYAVFRVELADKLYNP